MIAVCVMRMRIVFNFQTTFQTASVNRALQATVSGSTVVLPIQMAPVLELDVTMVDIV
jgi:hypothetical protein